MLGYGAIIFQFVGLEQKELTIHENTQNTSEFEASNNFLFLHKTVEAMGRSILQACGSLKPESRPLQNHNKSPRES